MALTRAGLMFLIAELDRHSFYRYVAAANRDELQRECLKRGCVFLDTYSYQPGIYPELYQIIDVGHPDATQRAYVLDIEALIDSGLGAFVMECDAIFRMCGITIERVAVGPRNQWTIEGRSNLGPFRLTVNPITTDRRNEFAISAFNAINTIFGHAGNPERLYATNDEGDSVWTVLLTPEMFSAIKRHESNDPGQDRLSVMWIGTRET